MSKKRTVWLTRDVDIYDEGAVFGYELHFDKPIWSNVIQGWVSISNSNVRTYVAHNLYPPSRRWKGGVRSYKELRVVV